MRHVYHQIRANFARNCAKFLKVNHARICCGSGDNHPRLFFHRKLADRGIIKISLAIYAVGNHRKQFARKIHGRAVREVPAERQAHAHHFVSGFQKRKIHCHIGGRPRKRLHIDAPLFTQTKNFLRAFNCKHLNIVNHAIARIVALVGVSFRVFIGKLRAECFAHRPRDDVFRRDQINRILLAAGFCGDECCHFRIIFFELSHGMR